MDNLILYSVLVSRSLFLWYLRLAMDTGENLERSCNLSLPWNHIHYHSLSFTIIHYHSLSADPCEVVFLWDTVLILQTWIGSTHLDPSFLAGMGDPDIMIMARYGLWVKIWETGSIGYHSCSSFLETLNLETTLFDCGVPKNELIPILNPLQNMFSSLVGFYRIRLWKMTRFVFCFMENARFIMHAHGKWGFIYYITISMYIVIQWKNVENGYVFLFKSSWIKHSCLLYVEDPVV